MNSQRDYYETFGQWRPPRNDIEGEYLARRKQRRENLRTIGLLLLLVVANFLLLVSGALAAGTDRIDDSKQRGELMYVERAVKCSVYFRIAAEGMDTATPRGAQFGALSAMSADKALMYASAVAIDRGRSVSWLGQRQRVYIDQMFGGVMMGNYANFAKLVHMHGRNCAAFMRDPMGALKRSIRDAR